MRKLVLLVVLAALTPTPGRAATYTVSLTGNRFVPAARDTLVAGDEVTFHVFDGTHRIIALQNGEFDSGPLNEDEDFPLTFAGGIVRFRCQYHSRLSNGFECTGMCGVLADHPTETVAPSVTIDAQPPAIAPPVPPSNLNASVTFAGSATDDTAVWGVMLRLYDTMGVATEYMATCGECGGLSSHWSFTRTLAPGSYVAEAIAVDTSGNVPASFPRTSFIVL